MCWYVYKNNFVTNYCWNCSEIFQLLTMLSCIYFSSLVPKCLTSGIVTQIFPLHDREKLKALEHKWYLSFNRKQPLGNLNSSIWSIFGSAKHFFWVAIILVFFSLQTVLKITLEKQLPCILDSWVSTLCRLFHQYCWLWYLLYLELMSKPKIQSLQSWTSSGQLSS